MPSKNSTKKAWCRAYFKDSNSMSEVDDESVQLVITTPPEVAAVHTGNLVKKAPEVFSSVRSYNPMMLFIPTQKVLELANLQKRSLFDAVSGLFPLKFIEGIIKEVYRVLKPNGVFLWNMGNTLQDYSCAFGSNRINCLLPFVWAEYILHVTPFRIKEDFIWVKTCSSQEEEQLLPHRYFLKNIIADAYEHFFMFTKGDEWKFHLTSKTATLLTWFMFPPSKRTDRITPFNEDVIRRFLEAFTDQGDTVLDCMAGTGTLGKVAVEMGRNCVLYEKDESLRDVLKAKVGDAFEVP